MSKKYKQMPRVLRVLGAVLALVLCSVFLPRPVWAKDAVVTEMQMLQAAMQHSPSFQAVYQNAAFDTADADQVARLDNPVVELKAERQSSPGEKSTGYDVELEQPFKLSHLTGTRFIWSQALLKQADLRQKQGIIQAYWEIRLLYARVWQLQEKIRLYREFRNSARDTATRIAKAVKAGQQPVSEQSLFTGDVARFESDLEQVSAEELQARLQLEKATGIVLRDKRLARPVLKEWERNITVLEQEARQNASLVRLLEADLYVAEKQKNAALADSILPEIAPRFIYNRNPRLNEDAVGVGVVLTIPLWDRQQSERQKADANRVYAQRQLDTLQVLPLSERIARIANAMQRLDKRITLFEKDVLPQYRKGFSQALRSFNAGQIDAAALWQIRERLFDTESDALEAVVNAVETRRLLSLETGILPSEVM